jgi:hypothetical protein
VVAAGLCQQPRKEKVMTDSDTYRKALHLAITDLIVTLTEAGDYLYRPDYPLAAIATLTNFSDKADDVKAALRLYTNAMRRQK